MPLVGLTNQGEVFWSVLRAIMMSKVTLELDACGTELHNSAEPRG